jgi:hypothetical protein
MFKQCQMNNLSIFPSTNKNDTKHTRKTSHCHGLPLYNHKFELKMLQEEEKPKGFDQMKTIGQEY